MSSCKLRAFAEFLQSFGRCFPKSRQLDCVREQEEPDLMREGPAINLGVFFQKSLKGRGRNRSRRTPSYFPLSQGGEFGGHASGNKNTDCLCLAQVISLPPGLKPENDRSGRSLRYRCFELLGKEPFKCRSGDGLRRGARPLPCWRVPSFTGKPSSTSARTA